MASAPQKRISFKAAAKRLKQIRREPLEPALIKRLNELMEKSEEELKEWESLSAGRYD